eukprot:m.374146 g.374146  ORF g.374146 m.374146 type:complete len:111 (+) comp56158_c0_seq22:672-1004(+)
MLPLLRSSKSAFFSWLLVLWSIFESSPLSRCFFGPLFFLLFFSLDFLRASAHASESDVFSALVFGWTEDPYSDGCSTLATELLVVVVATAHALGRTSALAIPPCRLISKK